MKSLVAILLLGTQPGLLITATGSTPASGSISFSATIASGTNVASSDPVELSFGLVAITTTVKVDGPSIEDRPNRVTSDTIIAFADDLRNNLVVDSVPGIYHTRDGGPLLAVRWKEARPPTSAEIWSILAMLDVTGEKCGAASTKHQIASAGLIRINELPRSKKS